MLCTVDSDERARPLNASMQYGVNVKPVVEKTLEMIWRFPGEFLEIF
jgi:hypothetical protein